MPVAEKKLVVAEDDESELLLLQHAAQEAGLDGEIHVLRDGQEVMDYFDRMDGTPEAPPLPKLLVLDLKMPKRNGFDVLKYLKSRELFGSLAVVVFSNSNLYCDIESCRQLGAREFITKPTQFTSLIAVLRDLRRRYLS